MNPEGLKRQTGMREPAATGPKSFLGVSGLDELLAGGLESNTQIMSVGETGVGKTVLAAQFLYEGLLVGDCCICVSCDEPPAAMRLSMSNLRLGTIAYERSGQLTFVDAYSRERSTERDFIPNPGDLDEYFSHEREAIERCGARRVRLAVDSLSTIYGTRDRGRVIEFNRSRLRYLSARDVFTLDNYVSGLLDEATMAGLSHSYPLIVRLAFVHSDGQLLRSLQIGKLRSGMFSGDRKMFRIDPRTGIITQR